MDDPDELLENFLSPSPDAPQEAPAPALAYHEEEPAAEEQPASAAQEEEESAPLNERIIKEEMVESSLLVGEESLPGIILEEEDDVEEDDVEEEEEEAREPTETEKQMHEIMEENDKAVFEADLEKYLETESADKAAIHATIQKQKASTLSYSDVGFQVVELFPRKGYIGYFLVLDGYKMILNTKRNGCCVFRCRYHDRGCNVRVKMREGFIGKINDHNHTETTVVGRPEPENGHYSCIYCSKSFEDLGERKEHMLNEPHSNAPWPMDEELCIFAEFVTAGSEQHTDDPEPMDKRENVGLHVPLPNKKAVVERLFIRDDCWLGLYRPGERIPPIIPNEHPYPYSPIGIPTNSHKRKFPKHRNSEGGNSSPASSGRGSADIDIDENAEESGRSRRRSTINKTLEKSISSGRSSPATEQANDDSNETKPGRSSRKSTKHVSYTEGNSGRSSPALSKTSEQETLANESDTETLPNDSILKITNSNKKRGRGRPPKTDANSEPDAAEKQNNKRKNRSSPAVPSSKYAKSQHDGSDPDEMDSERPGRPGRKPAKHKNCEASNSGRSSPAARRRSARALKDDESRTVSQRIDNVIEEYENKVVLYCDLCSVRLGSLKEQADHDLSKDHIENKRLKLQEESKARASLAFNKPIFTEEFLVYNKALEAELRSLRKGAVELEEQNAVLASHISELTDVVKELTNAKAIMQKQHHTLDDHLKDLKSELSKVFANVLSTEVSADNFNETFNQLSVAITEKNVLEKEMLAAKLEYYKAKTAALKGPTVETRDTQTAPVSASKRLLGDRTNGDGPRNIFDITNGKVVDGKIDRTDNSESGKGDDTGTENEEGENNIMINNNNKTDNDTNTNTQKLKSKSPSKNRKAVRLLDEKEMDF